MHIFNIMLSAASGGIQQSFADYCEGLKARGHRVTAVTHPNAAINAQLQAIGVDIISLRNFGEWDIFAARRLRSIMQKAKPDITITHGSRAFLLADKACGGLCPLVAVAHNYNKRIRHFAQADGVFSITHDLIQHMNGLGIDESRMFHIPNMVRSAPQTSRHERHRPPVIGSMGRFVKKKGFDVYIDALTLLHRRGYNFKAILGGSGEEEKALRQKADENGLDKVLTFTGWVEDKDAFFKSIDIFCLPSLHEPFGIVLLEAFVRSVPVITTDSEGPRDFITPNFDALVVPMGNASEMAEAIIKLLDGEHLADELAANAYAKAQSTYSMESISQRIETALIAVITRWRQNSDAA